MHDLLTGPFGHSFQYVMEDNPFEQRFEHSNLSNGTRSRFLQKTLAAAHFAGRQFSVRKLLGDTAEEVYAAIRGEGPFGPIISGTLDLDNLDNVVRLGFHMGLCDDTDRSVPARLAPLLEPHHGKLGAHAGTRPLMERWFDIRRRSYEFLLLDRGEFAAKAMLTLAIELAADAGLLGPDDWRLTDESLLNELEARSVGEHQFRGQIVQRLRIGDLFECVAVWKTDATAHYQRLSEATAKRELQQLIEEKAALGGRPRLKVCLHYILDRKKTCRSLAYRNLDTGEDETVGYDSNTLLVGAFIMNARAGGLTTQERHRMSEVIKDALVRAELGNLNPAPEPLASANDDAGLFRV